MNMQCPVCEKEILNDGELVIKSFVGGRASYVHTCCHYQHLLNHVTDNYLEFEEFEKEIKKQTFNKNSHSY